VIPHRDSLESQPLRKDERWSPFRKDRSAFSSNVLLLYRAIYCLNQLLNGDVLSVFSAVTLVDIFSFASVLQVFPSARIHGVLELRFVFESDRRKIGDSEHSES
jgi:hypothetical protein